MSLGILAAGLALGPDRAPAGRGRRRAVGRPDEDAVTLAVDAAAAALAGHPVAPSAVLLVSTTAPYEHGGSVQLVVELLGLQGALFATELTATDRDGLAALRLALSLAETGDGPVLVCATHSDRASKTTGDGAVALLIGRGDGLAELSVAGSHVEELRDRWSLRGGPRHEADRSFVESIGTERLARTVWDASATAGAGARVLIDGPDARSSARLERELGGPGDLVAPAVGHLGPAHALARLLTALAAPSQLVAVAAGQGDCLRAVPTAAGAEAAAAARALVEAPGQEIAAPPPDAVPADFHPYHSIPRSWRERGADLRLEGILPPGAPVPGRDNPTGTVVTWTRDCVYPAAPVTGMAIVDVDGGGRFFGQVCAGEEVEIGSRIRLVPRRLHSGGDVVQYFWKVSPCR